MTPKRERFVAEYLVDLNATQAAIRAGYSAKTANEQGARLLANASVASAVKTALEKRAERTEITQDRVLQEIARIAFSDLRRMFGENGGLKRPEDLDDDTAAALASIEVVTRSAGKNGEGETEVEHVHKVKAWDKARALEMLGRHLAMFTDKTEHSAGAGMAELLGLINGTGRPRPGR